MTSPLFRRCLSPSLSLSTPLSLSAVQFCCYSASLSSVFPLNIFLPPVLTSSGVFCSNCLLSLHLTSPPPPAGCGANAGVYGDVQRVKILYNKKDSALIQMSDANQAQLGERRAASKRRMGGERVANGRRTGGLLPV